MGTLSDLIEEYIRQRLNQSADQEVELSRAQLAEVFSCVPSQINYVLTTRFTLERGFIIESRRGGGGYIRISRIQIDPDRGKTATYLLRKLGTTATERTVEDYLTVFQDLTLIDEKDAQLIRGIIQRETSMADLNQDQLRASLLRALLVLMINK